MGEKVHPVFQYHVESIMSYIYLKYTSDRMEVVQEKLFHTSVFAVTLQKFQKRIGLIVCNGDDSV